MIYHSPLEEALIGIRLNKPAMFAALQKKMCAHDKDVAIYSDDGELELCTACGSRPNSWEIEPADRED